MDGKGERYWLPMWATVAAFTLVGLALRIAAARGGMWTDEAWSVVNAAQARDPLGVFLRINHDNNHHLNSLWLQAVGMHASPILSRAPAILAGTLAIPTAALLFARRSAAGAIAAAALFAISPIMVIYGSEARGYSSMMLAMLFMTLLTTNAVEGRSTSATPWLIALTAALGILSHLTMLAPVALLTLWVYLEKRSSNDVPGAMRDTLILMGPGLAASTAMLLLVLVPAILSPTGLQTGGYNPFNLQSYIVGVSNMEIWAVGWTFPMRWLAIIGLLGIGLALIVRPPAAMGSRARLYGILILGVPLVIFVERIGNSQFARFFLCTAIALLLLGAEWVAQASKSDGRSRALCAAAGLLFVVTAFLHDQRFLELARGKPELAIQLMEHKAPGGALVDVQTHMFVAPMVVAANQADYPLALAGSCGPAEFMIVAREASSTRTIMRCGRAMRAIGWSEATDLTGDSWILYAA